MACSFLYSYLNEEHENHEIIVFNIVVLECFVIFIQLFALVNELNRANIFLFLSCDFALKFANLIIVVVSKEQT